MSTEELDQGFPQEGVPDLPSSALDRIKRRRDQLATQHTTFMEIPGYEGLLIAEYSIMTRDQIEKQRKRVQAAQSSNKLDLINPALDTLIDCCVGLYYMEDDERRPFNPEHPVRFDAELASILNMPIEGEPSARKVLRCLFGNNDMAVLAHNMEVMEWMTEGTAQVYDDFEQE